MFTLLISGIFLSACSTSSEPQTIEIPVYIDREVIVEVEKIVEVEVPVEVEVEVPAECDCPYCKEEFKDVVSIKYGTTTLTSIQEVQMFVFEATYDGVDMTEVQRNMMFGSSSSERSKYSVATLKGIPLNPRIDLRLVYEIGKEPELFANWEVDGKIWRQGGDTVVGFYFPLYTVNKLGPEITVEAQIYQVKVIDNNRVMIKYPDGSVREVGGMGFEIGWM